MFAIAQADDRVHEQSVEIVSRPVQHQWSAHRVNCERGSASVASLYRLRNTVMRVLAHLRDVPYGTPQEVEQ